jgi:thiamine-phosphate pyrophosphorylase
MSFSSVVRVLDASFNRASEGLRVVEDYVRFVVDDAHLTAHFKRLRHDLTAASTAIPLSDRHASRDTQEDIGTTITTASESQRADAWSVCQASLERAKQSLRSLEEYSKILTPQIAAQFESLRYRLYTLEGALGCTADALARLGDVRLYVLVDGRDSAPDFESLARELIAAGVDAIQLRDKRLEDRNLIARARILRRLLQPRALPGGRAEGSTSPGEGDSDPRAAVLPLLIINDRPDIAVIVDADGVHLGQEDMTVKDARQIVGPRKLIGVSTHSIDQARAAVLDGASYIGVGPTFPSPTKAFDAHPGLPLLRHVAAEIRLPAFVIGGVSGDNVSEVVAAGFRRIAVSSALTEAADPSAAVAALRKALTL